MSLKNMCFIPNPRAPEQVFGLATPHHLLIKLYWEISELEAAVAPAPPPARAPAVYHAYNCAVTAWHCADWAWKFANPNIKKELSSAVQSASPSRRDFFNGICERSRDLQICRSIANGSKHMGLNVEDATVRADVEFYGSLEDNPNSWRQVLFVYDDNKKTRAEVIFRNAADFWSRLFTHVGYDVGNSPR
jgi:hypothetical protein